MREVTRYEANDGSIWTTQEKAEERDADLVVCEQIVESLGPRPKDSHCNFSNGHGYVPHLPEHVLLAQKRWDAACLERFGTCHPRAVDDYQHPLRGIGSRLRCIDESGREWGQPFFALNPTKGKQVVWEEPTDEE